MLEPANKSAGTRLVVGHGFPQAKKLAVPPSCCCDRLMIRCQKPSELVPGPFLSTYFTRVEEGVSSNTTAKKAATFTSEASESSMEVAQAYRI